MDHWLNEKDAANVLGFSVYWMQQKRCTGGGPPFVKVNGFAIRYRESDIQEWMKGHGTRRHTSEENPDRVTRKIERKRLDAVSSE